MFCAICTTRSINTITTRVSVGEATIPAVTVCYDCATTNLNPIPTNLPEYADQHTLCVCCLHWE